MKQIRVLLADDHALIRSGIRELLERVSDFQIVGEAGDGEEALRLIEQHQPDVVLMDITMPPLDGLHATARVTKEFPGVRVVILSVHADEEYVRSALRSGASGYLAKSVGLAELEMAIRAAANGQTYLNVPPSLVELPPLGSDEALLERLTPRQRQVLRLVAEGRSNKGIALCLNVSVKTVETHRTQLMDRLGIHDTARLVRYAIKAGIVRT